MKKVIKLICICLCIFSFINVKALDLDISSKYAVMYNLNDNGIVYELNKDEKTSIASLTKIMTTLVAIENIENMDEKVVITHDMLKGLIEANAYVIGLREGQEVTYRDLLYGTFLPSGADTARGLALSICNTEEEFVTLMNNKANDLGLNELHFANVVGLDDEDNYGTVNGVAKLLMEALKNDQFKEMFTTSSYTLSDNSMTVSSSMRYSANTYHLDISYIEGGKTGLTDDAGKCLASVAMDELNNIEYLLVTTNASTSRTNAYHVLDATIIYNYFFDNYKYYDVINNGDVITSIPVKYIGKNINITSLENITYYSDNTFNNDNITIEHNIESISPLTKVGTKIGEATIKYNGNEIKTIDLYLNDKIEFNLVDLIKSNVQITIIFILSIVIVLLLFKKKSQKNRKRLSFF